MRRKAFLTEQSQNVIENKGLKTWTVGAPAYCPPSMSPDCGRQFEPVNRSLSGQTGFTPRRKVRKDRKALRALSWFTRARQRKGKSDCFGSSHFCAPWVRIFRP